MLINFEKYKIKDMFLMDDKIMENLKIALSDKAFAEKIVRLDTPEEVKTAFKEKGIEISDEGIQLLGSILNKMAEKQSTELSEEDLQEIAGGEGLKSFATGFKAPFVGYKGERTHVKPGDFSGNWESTAANVGTAFAGASVIAVTAAAAVGNIRRCKKVG